MDIKKILIVDDEPDFVKAVGLRLKANGYDIIEAFDGEEGVKEAFQNAPDLILLDIMMPEKDGFTMLKELKRDEKTKGIPVIVLTAKPDMKELFEPEGVFDYIIKPFEPEELIGKINKALGGA